ncbi:MAG: hypothetical protein AAF221_10850 [Pseudomonadota bacterium]
MTPGPFSRFIAVDWSGAKTNYSKKLTVAVCESGDEAPRLADHSEGWSRERIVDYIVSQPAGTLTGFDFSFAPPFMDKGAYLPGEAAPTSGPDFWAHVDALCKGDADCGAHTFIERAYRRHFYLGKADGVKANFMRWRACETAFNASGGGKAACVFDAIGAAQVSKASFAGMRVLHRLRQRVAIWPFQTAAPGQSAVAEIYCRAYIRHAGLRGLKVRDLETLNTALAAFESAPYSGGEALSDDQTDVLITAAGMRRLAQRRDIWHPAGLTEDIAMREGWTFGVF